MEPELLPPQQRRILPAGSPPARGDRRTQADRRTPGGDPRGHVGRDPGGLCPRGAAPRDGRSPCEPRPAVGSDVPPERCARDPVRQECQPLRRPPRAVRRPQRLLSDGLARVRCAVRALRLGRPGLERVLAGAHGRVGDWPGGARLGADRLAQRDHGGAHHRRHAAQHARRRTHHVQPVAQLDGHRSGAGSGSHRDRRGTPTCHRPACGRWAACGHAPYSAGDIPPHRRHRPRRRTPERRLLDPRVPHRAASRLPRVPRPTRLRSRRTRPARRPGVGGPRACRCRGAAPRAVVVEDPGHG